MECSLYSLLSLYQNGRFIASVFCVSFVFGVRGVNGVYYISCSKNRYKQTLTLKRREDDISIYAPSWASFFFFFLRIRFPMFPNHSQPIPDYFPTIFRPFSGFMVKKRLSYLRFKAGFKPSEGVYMSWKKKANLGFLGGSTA